MNNYPSFLDKLNAKQREICVGEDNYVITACPGSGKTRLITYRLGYLQWKYAGSRKYNIAITYTNRAANEIESRLDEMGMDCSSVWCGTIHQFCMCFIIRPYSMYSKYLKNGYKIIDEYVSLAYCKEISKTLGINCKFKDPLSFPEIEKEYYKMLLTNREIDFDLILKLSFKLLKDNPFISENIAAIVRSFHIDEFQDTNELQYKILAEIVHKNNTINVVFVGDTNQAIYSSLGATPKKTQDIIKLFEVDFIEDTLFDCYRSTKRVIDFYSNFEVVKTGACSIADRKNEHGCIKYNTVVHKNELVFSIKSIIEEQLQKGVPENEICIVSPQWHQIFSVVNSLKIEMPSLCFDAPDISVFKYDPINPFYLLAKLLFTKPGTRVKARKKLAGEILDIIVNDYRCFVEDSFDKYSLLKAVNSCRPGDEDGMAFYERAVDDILKAMKIKISEESSLEKTLKDFLSKCDERIDKFKLSTSYEDLTKCFMEKKGVVVNTIHGVKGEEYTTLIAFGLLNGKLPNWSYICEYEKKPLRYAEASRLLYVLSSRAKENLYLFSEKGCLTEKGYEYTPTDELLSVDFDYD